MRVLAIASFTALLLAGCGGDGDPLTDGWSGGITDGTYRCSGEQGGTMTIVGDVQIEDARYGGLSTGWLGAYSVADDGSVEFSEGFDGLPPGYEVERATWTVNPAPVLAIFLASGTGGRMDLTCTPVTDDTGAA